MKRTITVPFLTSNEEKYLDIPNLFTIGPITIAVRVKLPNPDSVLFSYRLSASPSDLLPFEASFSVYSDSGIITGTEFTNKFYNFIPYTDASCLFTFKKYELLRSWDKSKEFSMNLTIEIKTDQKVEKKLIQPSKDAPNNGYQGLLNLLNQNSNVSQKDLDTIKKDLLMINSPTPTSPNNYTEKDKIKTPIANIDSFLPKKPIFEQHQEPTKPKEPIQSKPIKESGYTTQYFPTTSKLYNGLHNQGATCYLNAIIQSLYHLPLFRNVIFQFKSNDDKENEIISSLQALFYNLENSNSSCMTNYLTASLGMNSYDVFIHQDAQEFLVHFTETLEKILKKDEKQKDKISYIFGGKTIQTVQNNRHQIISSHEEEIFELIIGLTDSVEKSLSNFIKEEKINDYNDDETQSVQTVTMQTKLLNLPRVLKLLIKRYKYDKDLSLNCKDNSRMTFKEDLDMSPYVYNKDQNRCTKYKLYGVIVHIGQINSGHYYAYLRPEMKENWFLFNDSYVSKSTSYDAIDNNFGGVNNGFDFTRNYSAYILIYVCVDSIDEIFMKSQNEATKSFKIPRYVSYLAEEGNRKELQSKKSDNLCQITFNIFNERCLIENLTKGIVDICNDEYKFNISVDLRSKSTEIYQKVSNLTMLNINCIRLWTLSGDYKKLTRIVSPEQPINQIQAQNLFLEIKNENEKLIDNENSRIYFIVLYTKLITKPFLYLKAGHYKPEQFLYNNYSVPLRYDTIIKDALTIINQNLSTEIQPISVNAYTVNSNKIKYQFSTSNCSDDNGSIIILQVKSNNFNPDESVIDIFDESINTNKKLQYIKKKSNNENKKQTNAIFNYFDFMVNELPESPEKFFENHNNTKIVKVRNFNDISKIEGTIEIPMKIKTSELINFIKIAFEVDNFNDKKECILLFAREENSELPRSKPIDKYGTPFMNENIETIFYCITSLSFSRDYSSKTRVIQFSKNGYSVSKTVCYYMPNNEVHPFEQFRVLNDDLFSDNIKTRMFIVKNNEFGEPIVDENNVFIDNQNILRIEKVAPDQISNELILVQKASVGKYNKIEAFDDPFYFAYIENEPVYSFKERINKFLGKRESFLVCKKRSYYNADYIMNENIKIDKWEKTKCLYLLYDNNNLSKKL